VAAAVRRRHFFQVGRFRLQAKMKSTPSSRQKFLPSHWFTPACTAIMFAIWCGAAWCAADTPRGTVSLWTGDDQWIRLEPQDDSAAAPNDQPAKLDQSAVTNALSALRVSIVDPDTGTATQRPVFTREEVANLAPHFTTGLAQAGPRQDIVFSTVGSRSRGAGSTIKDPSVNAGRVFYQGGKLNVIFGELQSNYRKKNVYGQRDQDFTPRRTGSRDKVSEQKIGLAATSGVGSVRSDWLAIDLAVAGTSPPPAATAAAASVQPAPPPAATAAAAPSPSAPPPPVVAPAPVAKSTPAPTPAMPAAPAASDKSADIERRLRALKDLKDKGLITEEAYQAKMKELLSEL
jgi:hypothetical protein